MEGIHHDGNIIKTKSFLNLWNICAGIYRLLFSGLMAGIRIDSECEIKLKIVSSKFYLILHVFQKFTKYFKNEKLTYTVEISLN